MSEIVIYHNPRCSKSRQVLQLLREKGFEPLVVEYLKHPLNEHQIKCLLKMLGMTPREMIRNKEAEYCALGLDRPALIPADLIKAIADHPVLMERPIVVVGERAVVGRPPERVLDILG